MPKFDLNDPYDIALMNAQYDGYSEDAWEKYIAFAKEKGFKFEKIGKLQNALRKARLSKYLTSQQVSSMLSIAEEIETMILDDEKSHNASELLASNEFQMPVSHATFRVAWHDNKWNGRVCNNPETNTYCNGFHSLLSERIRRNKEDSMALELANRGKLLSEIDYLPPCFWSINLFGDENLNIKHENPAAPKLNAIKDILPSKSLLTWPFSVSFTRTTKEKTDSGAYPKNLEQVRIPRFNAKFHEGKSIAFFYAKFSNPLTEEEQQYLVVGAGIIDKKENASDIKHFGPNSEIAALRARPQSNYKYRNFPSMNWAMRFSFEDYSTVRMPYHEYLEAAERLPEEDRDTFLKDIKVAISEPELEWCFKYVAMDIGDDEAIYVLTKMRKALIACKDDGVVSPSSMVDRIEKVDGLLALAWSSRSYFPGFVSLSKILMYQVDEPKFKLEAFYNDFKELESDAVDKELESILTNVQGSPLGKVYGKEIKELKERLEQRGISVIQFLQLAMLNLNHFQFQRILEGKLNLPEDWIRNFDDVKKSHAVTDIVENPYLLFEEYQFWPDSHDDVYGEELDSPIDLFKIDIAYFPHSNFKARIDLQSDKMSFTDKKRIRALILRHLRTLENSGDCFTDAAHLQKAIANYPLFYETSKEYVLPEGMFHPLKSEVANHFQADPQQIVLIEANDTTYFYLSKVYNAEKNVENKIKTLLNAPDLLDYYPELFNYLKSSVGPLRNIIGENFDELGFNEERETLYKYLFKKRFFVVSGSAGSGKSFEIINILNHLDQDVNQKYLLLAPTGKAALRLRGDSHGKNIEAFTIDKFLTDVKYKKISPAAIREYKNIIIDESSMVDLIKFEKLLNVFDFKEPSFRRLIIIGDPNQLPAIGYGRVLEDILAYLKTRKEYKDNFVTLETNCRSELTNNDVLVLADAFKKGGEFSPALWHKFKDKTNVISEGFRARYWGTKDELYNQIQDEFDLLTNNLGISGNRLSRLNQAFGLTHDGKIGSKTPNLENFQILTPYNSEFAGVNKLNSYIQFSFKKDLPLELRKNQFKRSDKIIRTKNYYNDKELVLSNGTMGFIMDKPKESFHYEDSKGFANISFHDIRSNEREFFDLAYAISVHKSQGSGFNHLFLVLPARFGLLSKEMLYTALTRTKKTITVFIQTNDEKRQNVLEIAQSRSFSSSRWTSLFLDKPFRFYELEPEPNVFVESRVELLIYHLLMLKRDELGNDVFNFIYELKPIINGEEVNLKTDFTIFCGHYKWYWEHLGLLDQRKYRWTWQNLKKRTYQDAGIWDNVITTDERNGINPIKIQHIINLIIEGKVETEDKHNKYSNHHYYLR